MPSSATRAPADPLIWAWRHPRTRAAAGLCIGSTDVPVDRRKAKRLARRVERVARRNALPRIVVTSQLRRSADVGRWLHRWGWVHRIEPALAELDFGDWEGRPWDAVERTEIDAWCEDFALYAPGGGESLSAMLKRAASRHSTPPVIVIGHAGWMIARRWLQEGRDVPATAAAWPAPPRYGELWRLHAIGSAESPANPHEHLVGRVGIEPTTKGL